MQFLLERIMQILLNQLEIRYPEFLDMSAADISRYNKLSGMPLSSLPNIQQQMVVERKKRNS